MPVMMVDSEGGNDEQGRHHCMVLCAADSEGTEHVLRTGRPLGTEDILDWLVELPKSRLIVGYSLGYDWAMWLRDMPAATRREMTADGKWVEYGAYRLQMLGNQVTVTRPDPTCPIVDGRRRHVRGHTCRSVVVHDVVKFYQQSFLGAIGHSKGGWGVVTEDELAVIEAGKEGRSGFTCEYACSDEAVEYSLAECRVGSRLVDALRVAVEDAIGEPLQQFFGAGSIAKMLLKRNGVDAHLGQGGWPPETPAAVREAVMFAYFGGRFEAADFGPMASAVEESDITSAYPATMAALPCLTHATWIHSPGYVGPAEGMYTMLHRVRWDLPANTRWGPFPWRLDSGAIICPRRGEGWYYGAEVAAARRMHPSIEVLDTWTLVKGCQCRPFDWVAQMYEWRMARGNKNDGPGIVAKLGLNSLYGAAAQSVGTPVWQSFIWAGLITSATRAKLLDAIRLAPDDVFMVATDAVFSRRPLGLESPGLGGWEAATYDDVFVVAPGVALMDGKMKTRGMSRKEFVGVQDAIRQAWNDVGPWARASTKVTRFIGLRSGLVRPDVYCQWVESERVVSVGSGPKREHPGTGGIIPWETPYRTLAVAGPGGMSAVYRPKNEVAQAWGAARGESYDQPD
jgi:hypothetical protein